MNLSNKINNSKGTVFQKKVWHEIVKIPSGKVLTYKQLAANIGKPNAARAVANACGANPFPVKVPCHRVVGSSGKLGGFSLEGGTAKKRALLAKESSREFSD
jgi:O-6-methylguanine DNA methyltransferase|tara:strand:+ start:3439 stop:3744 length:306 start_codon:yes stop_codon:yes gene_type:complete